MEPQDKRLSPEESLEIISEAIKRTKDDYRGNSFYFLLWGWLVALASFAFFGLEHFGDTRYFFLPFPIAAVIGIAITVIRYNRHRASAATESYLSYYLSRLWMILGISFIMVVYINVSQNQSPFTYTLLIAGIGTLVSGQVMKFKPMIIGGGFFFVAILVSVYLANDYKVLLHGIAIITGYLIPGYMLKNQISNADV